MNPNSAGTSISPDAIARAVAKVRSRTPEETFEQLRRHSVVHDDGSLQNWHAKLAIVEVRENDRGVPIAFWCLIPSGNKPGTAKIEVRRESLVRYLEEGSRVITATFNDETKGYEAGPEVHLVNHSHPRTQGNEIERDNLDSLPRYSKTRSRR